MACHWIGQATPSAFVSEGVTQKQRSFFPPWYDNEDKDELSFAWSTLHSEPKDTELSMNDEWAIFCFL